MPKWKLERLAKKWMGEAIREFEREGCVDGKAIIPRRHATIFLYLGGFVQKYGEEVGRKAFGIAIREVVKKDADVVGLIMETWMAKIPLPEEDETSVDASDVAHDLYEEYGSMENWPTDMRKEVLICSVENREGRQVAFMAEIDSDTREVADPKKVPATMTGHMSNFFRNLPN